MKITESQLRKIIAEEIASMSEGPGSDTSSGEQSSGLSSKTNVNPLSSALTSIGVQPTSINKIKSVLKDLKDQKIKVDDAANQLDTTEKNAIVSAFLKMVTEDDTTLITKIFSAVKGIASTQ